MQEREMRSEHCDGNPQIYLYIIESGSSKNSGQFNRYAIYQQLIVKQCVFRFRLRIKS